MSAETVSELKRELVGVRNKVNSLLDVLESKKSEPPVMKTKEEELKPMQATEVKPGKGNAWLSLLVDSVAGSSMHYVCIVCVN